MYTNRAKKLFNKKQISYIQGFQCWITSISQFNDFYKSFDNSIAPAMFQYAQAQVFARGTKKGRTAACKQ